MTEISPKTKLIRNTSISSQRQSDCSHCMVPAIPIITPIVHTSTYRVNSVEHFQQVISQVCTALQSLTVPGLNIRDHRLNFKEMTQAFSLLSSAVFDPRL